MAFVMAATDPNSGATYPDAYWRPDEMTILDRDKRARIVFFAYRDEAAAKSEQRSPLPGVRPKAYEIEGAAYVAAATQVVPSGRLRDLNRAAYYAYAVARADTLKAGYTVGVVPPTIDGSGNFVPARPGYFGPNGVEVSAAEALESFFASAVSVP